MENMGMLIFGGVCILAAFVGWSIYSKYRCPVCKKFFCKCK